MPRNKAPIEGCSYCGSNEGYYTKEQVHGSIRTRFNFNGSEADNGEMYEGLSYKGGKVAYCLACDKQLFKISELRDFKNSFRY